MLKQALVVCVSLAIANVLGCTGGPAKQGELHLSVQAVTSAAVAGVLYQIDCVDGTSVTQYVPIEAEGLSDLLDPNLAGQPFADFFTLLSPGVCTVTATAMLGPNEPAPGCTQVTEQVVIVPDVTTEIVLVIECEAKPVGGLDVVTVITDAPSVTDIDYQTTKFILQCEETTVTVTADGGQPPLTYAFQVVTTPTGANYQSSAAGNVFTFSAETPGLYQVQVTATDSAGSTTTFVFPIHVTDDANIEHCGEVCCVLPDGHAFFGDVNACIEAGGVQAGNERCEAELCCKTPAGPQIVEAASCPQGAALPLAMCEPTELCCKTPAGIIYVPTADDCKGKGGVVVSLDACTEEVCCKTAAGNVFVPAVDCPAGQQQPAQVCAPASICCRLQNGQVFPLTADDCKEKGGAPVALELCQPEVCCQAANGAVQTLPKTTCAAQGGTEVSADLCKEACCTFKDGSQSIMLVGNCQDVGGDATQVSDCKGVVHTETWQANYTLNPDAPCDPAPYLVVPSSGANQLAVYDLTTLLPLPTSPFDTCSNPSRVMMDANTDVYASCREGSMGGRVRKHTRDGVFIWETQLTNCTGARGVAMSGDGRLFAVCSAGTRAIHELAPATGAILATILFPTNVFPYGVSAGPDALYVAHLSSALTRIDLATFTTTWHITLNPGPYGVSADALGGVWIGGQTLQHIDAAGTVVDMVDTTNSGVYSNGYVTGVQVALDGTVSAALYVHDVIVHHDPLAATTAFWPADVTAHVTYGVTADAQNNIYSINRTSSSLTKYAAGTGAPTFFGPDSLNNTILVAPYGYSGDMTGITACIAGTTDVWISQPFDSGSPATTWGVISWVATTPAGSSVSVYISTDGGTIWTLVTNGQLLGLSAQTVQVKAILQTTVPGNNPTISNISINYTL